MLERIYNNMLPSYKLYVRRGTVSTLSELMAAALEYEQILEDEKGTPSAPNSQYVRRIENRNYPPNVQTSSRTPPRNGHVPATSRNRQPPTAATPRKIEIHSDTCFRCGQRGHTRNRCPNRAVVFCSGCGKTGILTRNCCGFPEN